MARRGRFFGPILKAIAERDRSNNNEVHRSVADGVMALSRSPDIPHQVAALVEEFAEDERVIGGIYTRFAQTRQRAIGDGEIVSRIIEWINSGGLSAILEFIIGLITASGGIDARSVDAISVTQVPQNTSWADGVRNEPEIR